MRTGILRHRCPGAAFMKKRWRNTPPLTLIPATRSCHIPAIKRLRTGQGARQLLLFRALSLKSRLCVRGGIKVEAGGGRSVRMWQGRDSESLGFVPRNKNSQSQSVSHWPLFGRLLPWTLQSLWGMASSRPSQPASGTRHLNLSKRAQDRGRASWLQDAKWLLKFQERGIWAQKNTEDKGDSKDLE